MTEHNIAVPDLYAAAFLIAHELPVLRIDAGGRLPGQIQFVFDRMQAAPLLDSYQRGGGVNGLKYAAAIRYVKHAIHHEKRGQR